jgi:hypothetical protein
MKLNANVPCPGVTANSDQSSVKAAMTGVLRCINDLLINMVQGDRVDNSRTISLMLQTLYRLIPCVHGYKGFVEVKEVDTRMLLLQLIKLESDFVNYWTLEVLMVLCRCPLNPRNNQQEFVNKHTLLTDHLLKLLIEMMSSRIDIPEEVIVDDEDLKPAEGMYLCVVPCFGLPCLHSCVYVPRLELIWPPRPPHGMGLHNLLRAPAALSPRRTNTPTLRWPKMPRLWIISRLWGPGWTNRRRWLPMHRLNEGSMKSRRKQDRRSTFLILLLLLRPLHCWKASFPVSGTQVRRSSCAKCLTCSVSELKFLSTCCDRIHS